ncbi:MAG: hypothetical protein UFJ18_10825 [Blautia sp.]|nr:hypothetical protein [Blautia sp.]
MRKFILGCVLMFSGIIGGSGWLIATVIMQGSGSTPSVWDSFLNSGNPMIKWDCFFIIIFYGIAIAGSILAIANVKDEKK